MRSHGIKNFPDPSAGGGLEIRSQSGIDPQSKRFQDAEKACRKLLPAGNVSPAQQAQAQAQALKFSACMRAHGVRNFPDPKFEGGGLSRLTIDKNSGIDPRSPVFQAAQKACQKLLPGKVSSGAQGPGSTQSSGSAQGKGPRGGLTLVP
jgi:hypothetical protein